MRLLVCNECETIDELPDFDGEPEDDILLENLISEKHSYTPDHPHHGNLLWVDNEDWKDTKKREGILREVRRGAQGGTTGMDPEAYALRNNYQEDALNCYSAHRRPKDGCIDWKDKSKIIGNSMLTDEEKRKKREHGIGSNQVVYLCDFCPVRSNYVDKKKYEKAGLYK